MLPGLPSSPLSSHSPSGFGQGLPPSTSSSSSTNSSTFRANPQRNTPPPLISTASCKLCSTTVIIHQTNDTANRANYLHNVFQILQIHVIINPDDCSSASFPLCNECLDISKTLWVCQNTLESLCESKRVLIEMLVEKAREGVRTDWSTGSGPPPPQPEPFPSYPLYATTIFRKQNFGFIKRLVADYCPNPPLTITLADAEKGGEGKEQLQANSNPGASLPEALPSSSPSGRHTACSSSTILTSSSSPAPPPSTFSQASTSLSSCPSLASVAPLTLEKEEAIRNWMIPLNPQSGEGEEMRKASSIEVEERIKEIASGSGTTLPMLEPIRKKLKTRGVEIFHCDGSPVERQQGTNVKPVKKPKEGGKEKEVEPISEQPRNSQGEEVAVVSAKKGDENVSRPSVILATPSGLRQPPVITIVSDKDELSCDDSESEWMPWKVDERSSSKRDNKDEEAEAGTSKSPSSFSNPAGKKTPAPIVLRNEGVVKSTNTDAADIDEKSHPRTSDVEVSKVVANDDEKEKEKKDVEASVPSTSTSSSSSVPACGTSQTITEKSALISPRRDEILEKAKLPAVTTCASSSLPPSKTRHNKNGNPAPISIRAEEVQEGAKLPTPSTSTSASSLSLASSSQTTHTSMGNPVPISSRKEELEKEANLPSTSASSSLSSSKTHQTSIKNPAPKSSGGEKEKVSTHPADNNEEAEDSGDEIFEVESSKWKMTLSGVEILTCIGVLGSQKDKRYYQCSACPFIVEAETPGSREKPSALDRMADHVDNTHKKTEKATPSVSKTRLVPAKGGKVVGSKGKGKTDVPAKGGNVAGSKGKGKTDVPAKGGKVVGSKGKGKTNVPAVAKKTSELKKKNEKAPEISGKAAQRGRMKTQLNSVAEPSPPKPGPSRKIDKEPSRKRHLPLSAAERGELEPKREGEKGYNLRKLAKRSSSTVNTEEENETDVITID
ncbi:unnamed protein product [Orchesella dallaii]|uniref:ZAD domain-containing protein n=1 Tax=Orchesella dallaii TaxID=48710 RepID=A0ABP1R474_9HEXA